MTLLIPAKVLLHVWSYDFYNMTLSTGKQRCDMINILSLVTHNLLFLNQWKRERINEKIVIHGSSLQSRNTADQATRPF